MLPPMWWIRRGLGRRCFSAHAPVASGTGVENLLRPSGRVSSSLREGVWARGPWRAGRIEVLALVLLCAMIGGLLPSRVWAQSVPGAEGVEIDRVVVRFTAPEIGGVQRPRFIFERMLAFEARLEALSDQSFQPTPQRPYRDVHLRSAMERHVAETILESLQVLPSPSAETIEARVLATRMSMSVGAGGAQAISAAARAEGLEPREVLRVVQRKARASLYLDRMVAPMLAPSDSELRTLHQSGRTPFSRDAYDAVEAELRRWYVSRRLREAVIAYFEGARSRVVLEIVEPQPR